MDWDDLRVFLAVARTESLSGAGIRLGMNASTVGRRIARLETSLGRVLFAKTPQGYALTAEGQRLVSPAEAAELVVNAGIIEKAPIAEKAIPGCNIVCIT